MSQNRNKVAAGALLATLALLITAACGGDDVPEETFDPLTDVPAEIPVSSPDFRNGEDIPARFTCDGEDISPQINWHDLPAAAESVTLIADDPDAPRGIFTHWVIYNLPPEPARLERAVPQVERLENGAAQGVNSFGDTGYGGPCPPGGQTHEYRFMVYALNATLTLEPGASAQDVLRAMQGTVLAYGLLSGMYARQ